MPGDDLTIATDQHWIDEAEPDDAVGDLSHLRKGMGAGIPRIGCQSLNRYPAQFGMVPGDIGPDWGNGVDSAKAPAPAPIAA